MNDLSVITNNQTLTMSSREIADLTGKRHADVMRDIRNMLDEIHSAQNCVQYTDSTGRALPMLMLNKEETLCLVSGYNAKLRMAIIRRWQEMELRSSDGNKAQHPDERAISHHYADLSKAYKDIADARDRIKALELSAAPLACFANVKTQQQLEDEFVCNYLSTHQSVKISALLHNIPRTTGHPFAVYNRRGESREMLRRTLARLYDNGLVGTSNDIVFINSH